ncbi:glutamate mutase subunit B [Micromonospora sp. ATCC 39149]|uniref:methylaspartate mutase n=1 Tax=Micromonospora sp. (strain ATCC 39149 / NRRL 15099 / SCC 1413) TaxID=219305 RepID=UPI0001A50925|nr:methylaspartate mutase [Micromonospora sp. ATCC 39149]EEP74803.1 glutamate mutase subunit B [Micromonospora sp. ATCC 39149]
MNFGEFVRWRHARGALVVQPRMGFADPTLMRAGLLATRQADAATVGTITLDSYTRVGDLDAAGHALRQGIALNGYPIVNHPVDTTRAVLDGVLAEDFPVQVRHGSARPLDIFAALIRAGLHATEGGPVSYCLPYGRTPLAESVANWAAACELLLTTRQDGVEPHLETFGGCMLGQLCPPSELVAISVLEALFFHRMGLRSISVSYAQQTNPAQDLEAVTALRRLCAELLPGADTHVVVYAYMGLAPRTPAGARRLFAEAVRLAVAGGAQRLIVKTVAEAYRIPTIAENVAALEHAAATARAMPRPADPAASGGQVYREARAIVEAVLDGAPDLGRAIVLAFRRGLLDVPYCIHPDNAGRSRSHLDEDGTLRWTRLGNLPLGGLAELRPRDPVGSTELLSALSYTQRTFDAPHLKEV